LKEGDVIVAPMLQADGTIKSRPVVILREMPPFGDLLVCGVSTQLRQFTPGFDELMVRSDSDFAASGLMAESVIRLGFLGVKSKKVSPGSIGAISPARHQRLLQKLSAYLIRDPK
jgi:mRNA interferase MazF